MNVGELKKIIADLPDDIPVLVPSADHSYLDVEIEVSTAIHSSSGFPEWSKDYGEETKRIFDKRENVVIIH